MDLVNAADRAFYENFNELGFNSPVPWSQGPRRMGTDKNADVLWVGNSWGNSLAKIDTKTAKPRSSRSPDKTMQPYHIAVDSNHNVWGNLWTSDQIVKFDPADQQVDHLRAARARHRDPSHLAPTIGDKNYMSCRSTGRATWRRCTSAATPSWRR